MAKRQYTPPPPKLGTPAQEKARAQAWATFKTMCGNNRLSNTKGRKWLADQMGIEERYAIIYDMDETECRTVVEICKKNAA